MNNEVIYLNIEKICRICLIESDSMTSVFSQLKDTEQLDIEINTLADILTKITSISVESSDGFPLQVCHTCVTLIHDAHKFKIQFDQSFNLLQQYISNKSVVPETGTHCNDDHDLSDNITIESPPVQHEGRRQTSRKQIKKRTVKVLVDNKVPRRRGRRGKAKIKNSDDSECADDEDVKQTVKFHPCPICTKEFSALELRQHAHTHKALKKYLSIPSAYKVNSAIQFYRKYDSTKEIVNIHNQKVKLHKCVLCGEELTALDLRIHLENHRNQKEYKCDQCERVFKKLNHLNTHRVKHLKEFPFKCEHCSKGFVIKKNYECHILTHKTYQELPHECSHCLKRFSNPEHLNRHIIIHTENVTYSVKYRVCKCHHCLKTFKDRDELKKHNCKPIEQTVNTRYPCKICNKVFKNSSGLYNHNRNIHKLKGAKVLCSVCGNYVSNIYNHMMRHTGEKPFQCNQCGKRFISKPQLRQHLLVHSGLKPYVCSVCAKAFNNLYNLQVHERIHKGDRCHICTICNKGFLEKSYLKKHMNVHKKI